MNKIFCWSHFVEESEVVFLTHNRVKNLTFDKLEITIPLYGATFGIKVCKLNGAPRSDYESLVKTTLENNPQKVLAIVRALEEGLNGDQHPVSSSYIDEKLLNLAFNKGKRLREIQKYTEELEKDDLHDLFA